MPRRLRDQHPGALYHVVSKGNAGGSIVRNDIDRRGFIVRLGEVIARTRWQCLAYCLLDTHFHLVIATPEPNLSDGMRWFKSALAHDLNFRHGRAGHVFGGRFYSGRIQTTDHLISAVIYVLLNPVRAGVVDSPRDWPWSSCAATVGAVPVPAFLDVGAVLELFGAEPHAARVALGTALGETLALDRAGGSRRVRGQTHGSDP